MSLQFIDRFYEPLPPPDASTTVVINKFPDPDKTLDTACDALRRLNMAQVSVSLEFDSAEKHRESFRITAPDAPSGKIKISSGDTEGIRRGIYELIRQLRSGTPLPPTLYRRGRARLRIGRCFFGPIKRPPLLRDELMDDIDYYPERYLDSLAADGINAVWITISLREMCRTPYTPDDGVNVDKRCEKLRRTVAKCRRYGIKVFLFANDPEAWPADDPAICRTPELGGPLVSGRRCFCPLSEPGQTYLQESMRQIFAAVPELGGMINIVLGENLTGCLSSYDNGGLFFCPRFAPEKCRPASIMAAMLDSMIRGMRRSSPEAELIAWFYLPFATQLPDYFAALIPLLPPGVTPMLNFESGAGAIQLGRLRRAGDYWLSNPAASPLFERFAALCHAAGVTPGAKIQTGSSHEAASVPYIPVPGLLYEKYSGLQKNQVGVIMQSWYFGCAPGIMNTAAALLAFLDCREVGKKEFLADLAKSICPRHTAQAADALDKLSEAFRNYPLSNMFQYYGPCADGVCWPLFRHRQKKMLLPTWQLNADRYNGDNIGECLDNHTLDEATGLMRRLSAQWHTATAALTELPSLSPDCASVAVALDRQFASAHAILSFYQARMNGDDDTMCEIMRREVINRQHMAELCDQDTRLGFHPEAEGYKYNAFKIRESVKQLQRELEHPAAPAADAAETYCMATTPAIQCRSYSWSLSTVCDNIVLHIDAMPSQESLDEFFAVFDSATTPGRFLHICSDGRIFVLPPGATMNNKALPGNWSCDISIPVATLPLEEGCCGFNIMRLCGNYNCRDSWPRHNSLMPPRLNMAFYNPSDMGRLIIRPAGKDL